MELTSRNFTFDFVISDADLMGVLAKPTKINLHFFHSFFQLL